MCQYTENTPSVILENYIKSFIGLLAENACLHGEEINLMVLQLFSPHGVNNHTHYVDLADQSI